MSTPTELLNRALGLLNRGKPGPAKALCKKLLHQHPDHFDALHLYGVICLNQRDPQRAADYLSRACLQKRPAQTQAQAHNNLSVAQLHLGQLDEALQAVNSAIELGGRQAAFLANRANIYELKQHWQKMADDLQAAHALDPNDLSISLGLAIAWRQLGHPSKSAQLLAPLRLEQDSDPELCWEVLLLAGLNQGEEAMLQQAIGLAYQLQIEPSLWLEQVADYLCEQQHPQLALPLYQQADALAPQRDTLGFKLAALRGDNPAQAPAIYVEQLYQAHADQFERRLIGRLGYRAPWLLAEQLSQMGHTEFERVLDLGCGSGLAGQQLHQQFNIEHLCGIDLSEQMLQLAQAKGCYDRLECAELIAWLKQDSSCYQLICALDVLIYQGDLSALFEQLSAKLSNNGLFAYTVELNEAGTPYQLDPSGRFRHSQDYLTTLARCYGLNPLLQLPINLRQEHQLPTAGLLIILCSD